MDAADATIVITWPADLTSKADPRQKLLVIHQFDPAPCERRTPSTPATPKSRYSCRWTGRAPLREGPGLASGHHRGAPGVRYG